MLLILMHVTIIRIQIQINSLFTSQATFIYIQLPTTVMCLHESVAVVLIY